MFLCFTKSASLTKTKLLLLGAIAFLFATVGTMAQVRIGTTNYSTLKGAFDAINNGTHTGAITITITGGTTETSTALLNASGNGNANYSSILISPTGNYTIQGSVTQALVQLNGADNVTIDGRINQSGTDNGLNFQNDMNANYGAVIWLDSVVSGVGGGCRNVTVRNCNIKGGSTTSSNAMGIVASASNSITGTAAGNDNLKILYCTFAKCYYGVRVYGVSTAYIQNLEIRNNIFGSSTDPVGSYACWTYYCNNTQVTNNDWFNLNPGGSVYYALYLYYGTNSLVEGNSIHNNIGTTSTCMGMYLVYASNSIVRNNSIYDINIAGNFYAIYNSSSTNIQVYNNTIQNINTSNGIAYIFYQASGANSVYYNNTINNITCTTTMYGNYSSSSSGSRYYNNSFTNMTSSGGVAYMAYLTSSSDCFVYNNIYKYITCSTTLYGLYATSANNTSIRNNLYGNLRSTSTSGYACVGIYISSGNGDTLINNVIYNLTSTNYSSTSTLNPFGIYLNGGTGHKIYHNSVNLYGSQSGTNTSGTMSAALYISSSASSLDLRNNTFSNSLVGLTGSKSYAVYITGTGALTGSTFNYNNYYASGTYGVLGYLSSDITSITAWRTATSQEANSSSTDPQFNANDNLRPSPASPLLSSGTPISGFGTDYYNITRSTTAPSKGAYEQGGDFAGPNIVYTPLTNTTSANNRTLGNVVMTDYSGINTTAGTRPRLYYRKDINTNAYNGNTNSTDGWKYVEADGTGGSPFSFTIDYSKVYGGVLPGDIIEYFVVAQDNNSTINVSVNSAIMFSNPTSVNLTGSHFPVSGAINRYAIQALLSGTVSVGTTNSYRSLSSRGGFFNVINNGILTGNLTVEITSDLLNETGEISLLTWQEQGTGNYTITFKPSAAQNRYIAGFSSGGLLKMDKVSRVTFDGRFAGSGNYLTIQQYNPGSSAAIQIISQGAGLGSSNITIRNCNLIGGGETNTTAYGIYVGPPTISTSGTGADNKNIIITENNIYNASCGVYIRGLSSNPADKCEVTMNRIGNETSSMSIGSMGITVGYASSFIVSKNTIFGVENTSNADGINIYYGTKNSTFAGNRIYDVKSTGTYRATGFYVATDADGNNLIYNNMIYGIIGNGTGGTSYGTYGIFLYEGTKNKIYHNTVNLTGNRDDAGATKPNSLSAALGVYYQYDIDLRNNIFINSQTAPTNRPYSYAIYQEQGAKPFLDIDVNDYYVTGPQAMLGYWNGTNVSSFGAWQSSSGDDGSSVSEEVFFVSATDLHLDRSSMASSGLNAMSLKDVSQDFDGETRRSMTQKGADEVNMVIGISEELTQFNGTVFCPGNDVDMSVTPIITGFVDKINRTVPSEGITTLSKYTWYKDDVVVMNPNSNTFTNGTSNVFTIRNMKAEDAKTYKVEIEYSNAPKVMSRTSSLYMEFPLAIAAQPVSGLTCEDKGQFTFSVTAGGTIFGTGSYTSMPGYQWQKEDPKNKGTFVDIAGANQNSYIADVRDAEAASGAYRVKVLGPGNCGPAQIFSETVYLTVAEPLTNVFATVNFPDPMFICTGENIEFSAFAAGTIVGYQWQRSNDGNAFEDIELEDNATARNPKLLLEKASVNATGYYRCLVYGDQTCNELIVPTKSVQIEVQPYFEIIEQPKPNIVCLGEEVIINVVPDGHVLDGANGDGYQWQKDGVNIDVKDNPTAKTPILIIKNANYDVSGSYRCVIHFEDCRGKLYTTTNEAQVYVLRETEFVHQPESQMVEVGGSVMFTFDAHLNDYPPDFQPEVQWYRGNSPLVENNRIIGVKSSILSIKNVNSTDFGSDYNVRLTAKCGNAQSVNIALVEKVSVIISQQPQSLEECEGAEAVFQAIPTIFGTLSPPQYQWYKNNEKLTDNAKYDGVNSPNLTISDINDSDAGEYHCYIKATTSGGLYAALESEKATLTVKMKPYFTTQLLNTKTVETGKELTLEVAAAGATPITYQWEKDGAELSGQTNPILTIASATMTDGGTYICKITNECATVSSAPCVVTVTLQGQTGVDDAAEAGYILNDIVPNPLSNVSTLSFEIPVAEHVKITLTDVGGREIARLLDKQVSPGRNTVEINAAELKLSSGVYFYTLNAGGYVITRRLIVSR